MNLQVREILNAASQFQLHYHRSHTHDSAPKKHNETNQMQTQLHTKTFCVDVCILLKHS